jgi:hypothetical protein
VLIAVMALVLMIESESMAELNLHQHAIDIKLCGAYLMSDFFFIRIGSELHMIDATLGQWSGTVSSRGVHPLSFRAGSDRRLPNGQCFGWHIRIPLTRVVTVSRFPFRCLQFEKVQSVARLTACFAAQSCLPPRKQSMSAACNTTNEILG